MSTKATNISRAVSRVCTKARKKERSPKPEAKPKRKDKPVESPKERMKRELAASIDRSARYLVTYDAKIIATFAREEDAFLLESELADLDRTHGVASGRCEVIDRRTGHRLGGYLMTTGKMLVFVRDDEHDKRFRTGRH